MNHFIQLVCDWGPTEWLLRHSIEHFKCLLIASLNGEKLIFGYTNNAECQHLSSLSVCLS